MLLSTNAFIYNIRECYRQRIEWTEIIASRGVANAFQAMLQKQINVIWMQFILPDDLCVVLIIRSK